jgi:hypothetical protein
MSHSKQSARKQGKQRKWWTNKTTPDMSKSATKVESVKMRSE